MQVACLESEKRGAYSMLREGQDAGTELRVLGHAGAMRFEPWMVRRNGNTLRESNMAGKSPLFIEVLTGKSSINQGFSRAMFD